MLNIKNTLALLMLFSSPDIFASGKHSAQINMDTIKQFRTIDTVRLEEPLSLSYIGTTTSNIHLFLQNKVAVSKRVDKNGNTRAGMPWNHIFKYQISSKTISITNGWTLDLSSNKSYNLKPGYCPRIQIVNNKMNYTLPKGKTIKLSCLSGRYIRRRSSWIETH